MEQTAGEHYELPAAQGKILNTTYYIQWYWNSTDTFGDFIVWQFVQI